MIHATCFLTQGLQNFDIQDLSAYGWTQAGLKAEP